jgi:transcriptional regulator with XRE-family HTH domain
MIVPARLYTMVGHKILQHRKKAKLTQAALAKAISLDRTSITNIEQGRQKILAHTLIDLSLALNTPLINLLPNKKEIKSLKIQPASSELKKLKNTKEEVWFTTIKARAPKEATNEKR